mmetsp:Transcript_19451/g.53431  ORF Transcript_19451/g.53431 Transcript_19451/m.53431 type:complete len:248 (+) Transcript_19451:137-880(+)
MQWPHRCRRAKRRRCVAPREARGCSRLACRPKSSRASSSSSASNSRGSAPLGRVPRPTASAPARARRQSGGTAAPRAGAFTAAPSVAMVPARAAQLAAAGGAAPAGSAMRTRTVPASPSSSSRMSAASMSSHEEPTDDTSQSSHASAAPCSSGQSSSSLNSPPAAAAPGPRRSSGVFVCSASRCVWQISQTGSKPQFRKVHKGQDQAAAQCSSSHALSSPSSPECSTSSDSKGSPNDLVRSRTRSGL